MECGSLELTQLQLLQVQNHWLINDRWTEADEQATYSRLLREKCKEPKDTPESDKRLDILGITPGTGLLTIVELKRPEKTLSKDDLDQIDQYVDWADENILGNRPEHGPTQAR